MTSDIIAPNNNSINKQPEDKFDIGYFVIIFSSNLIEHRNRYNIGNNEKTLHFFRKF